MQGRGIGTIIRVGYLVLLVGPIHMFGKLKVPSTGACQYLNYFGAHTHTHLARDMPTST